VHAAGVYALGVSEQEAAAMRDANVGGTERVLDAVSAAGSARAVYVSTMNAFGDTGGAVVDETYERDVSRGFLSVYDETTYRAHELVAERTGAGAPVVTVMPGTVYGPGDTSQLGEQVHGAMTGRLPYVVSRASASTPSTSTTSSPVSSWPRNRVRWVGPMPSAASVPAWSA